MISVMSFEEEDKEPQPGKWSEKSESKAGK